MFYWGTYMKVHTLPLSRFSPGSGVGGRKRKEGRTYSGRARGNGEKLEKPTGQSVSPSDERGERGGRERSVSPTLQSALVLV